MSGNSWVTLATNDSYSLGALVLAHSLKRAGTIHNLTVMVTPGVSTSMRNQLVSAFNVVQEVNILDSKDEENLALLTRPELGVTFTKLHCWRLTQFSKCVFLDADVLVLCNCDELFEREELSAAPDVGWPDCFNSGVFVYRPSVETYNAILNLALSQGSFDGGDQGLLNQFFSDWATKDISRHLPFIYNMCSSATYSYLPAFKQFGQDVKIVHFIGSSKPWLQYLDSETRQVRPTLGSEHLQGYLQLWWDIFCNDVHSILTTDMVQSSSQASQLENSTSHIIKEILLNLQPRQSLTSKPASSVYTHDPSYGYWDPWETYQEISIQSGFNKNENINYNNFVTNLIEQDRNTVINVENVIGGFMNNIKNLEQNNEENLSQMKNSYSIDSNSNTTHLLESDDHQNSSNHFSISNLNEGRDNHNLHSDREDRKGISSQSGSKMQDVEQNQHIQPHGNHNIIISVGEHVSSENRCNDRLNFDVNTSKHDCSVYTDPAHIPQNKTIFPSDNQTVNIPPDSECITPSATPDFTETDAGLAGALSQLTLGVARSPEQSALEEHLRKQAWEHGNIDYMGRDSFDNIWRKICQTLSEPIPGTEEQSASSV